MIAVRESVTAAGRAIDVRVEDGLDVRILPDRGFDLGSPPARDVRVEIDADEVVPRDSDAAAGDLRAPGPPGRERVYEHVGPRAVRARGRAGTVRVGSSLPRLWQRGEPAIGVLGVEARETSVGITVEEP